MSKAIDIHKAQLDNFSAAVNGNRNNLLNSCSIVSFGYALGNDKDLTISKVENDYTDAAKRLQMDSNSVKNTLRSALDAAVPYNTNSNGHNSNGAKPVSKESLKLAPVYTALEDYAIAHGVPVEAFEAAKWAEGEHDNRKCLKVPHEDGVIRCRFLDGQQPKWKPIGTGVKPCWYGFKPAIQMAKDSTHKTIVLCNGQPSVIAAHHYNVPALATTDGEGKKLEKGPLLKRLLDAIKEHELKIIIAMDGDDAGRKASEQRKDALLANGIQPRVVLFGGDDGFDLADYCKQHKTGVMDKLISLAAYGTRKTKHVYSRAELAQNAEKILIAPQDNIPAGEMMIMPFKRFHYLGGGAHILEPGLLTKILAPSGCGKTSLLETWQDFWNMLGFDSLWFSPEWTPRKMHYRTITRYSGLPTDIIKMHIIYASEVKRGIPKEQRQGKPLKPNSKGYNAFLSANHKIAQWPGMMYAFQGQKVTSQILEDMEKQLYLCRRNGRRVAAAFFDYAQLLRTVEEYNGKNSYELIVDEIKQWCMDNGIHGIVGSQPTKAVGQGAIESGKCLTKYDSNYLRPDAFNLIVTLNIKHNKKGDEYQKTTFGIANIAKNSEGEEGKVNITTNFKYLSWMDKEPNVYSTKG
jgi:hypothetical protein